MSNPTPRLSVRAIILHNDKLLLVNAYPDGQSDLWCAPGGGVESGASLPDNLKREVYEETGLHVAVGAPCLINELHDPASGFHQVDIFFRCEIIAGDIDPRWQDPMGVVTDRRLFSQSELGSIRFKPDSLGHLPWSDTPIFYDSLEPLVR